MIMTEEGSLTAHRYSRQGRAVRSVDSVITRLMADALHNRDLLSLAAGFTDDAVLPDALVRSAMDHLGEGGATAHLQYGMNRGRPGLRHEVLKLLRGYADEPLAGLDADSVIITNGSQQGLYILTQMLCDPGDIVLVQQPSYFVYLELLEGLGIEAISLPCRADGALDAEALPGFFRSLEQSKRLDRIKLVYLMGVFANPSTRCMDESEKLALRAALDALPVRLPVIEDMAYRELFFKEPYPARSLLSLPEWEDWPVIYTGTFTKPFATGLKTGFILSRDADLLDTLAKIKGHQDFGSGHLNQAIIEDVLVRGAYPDHLAGIRRHYARKSALLEGVLEAEGLRGAGWQWESPQGGLLMWLRGPEGTDTRAGSAFHASCLKQAVLYVPGDLGFAEGEPYHSLRLSFGALASDRLEEAGRRFARACLDQSP